MSAPRPREGSALLLSNWTPASVQSHHRFLGLEKAQRDQRFSGSSPGGLQADPVQMALLALSYTWGCPLRCFWKGKRSCQAEGLH